MRKEELFDILVDVNSQYVKEAHMKREVKNNYVWIKWGTIVACLIVAVLYASPAIQLSPGMKDSETAVEAPPIKNQEETLQSSANESSNVSEDLIEDNELDSDANELSVSDCLGWIVYENKVYMQDCNLESEVESNQINMELGEYLGKARHFEGNYRNEDACDGDVYLVADNFDIVCIKLENGGTVWLRVEENLNAERVIKENENVECY